MLEIFLEIQPLKKILEFQGWKKTAKLIQKEKKKIKPEIESMIANLQDKLYQLENKQAKSCYITKVSKFVLEKRCLS